nr:carboxypeptidase regulatory-like domain-containing protein [Nocardioides luti]
MALVTAMLALGFSTSATAAPRVAAGAGAGQKADPPPTIRGINTLDDYNSTISGLVYDSEGNLLDDIQVDAYSAADPTGEIVASDLTYEYQDAASHGAFQLHVPAGDYLIRFSSPEWAEQHVYETVYYGGGAGTPVTVADDDTVTLEDTTLVADHGAPVTGTVLDGSGNPLAGVDVRLVRMYAGGYYDSIDSAVTDATGTYTFPSVKHQGNYSVLAYGWWSNDGEDELGFTDTWLGDVPNPTAATRFTHPAGSDPYALGAIHLRPGAELHGTYVPAAGDDVDYGYYYASLYLQNPDGSLDYVDSAYVDNETLDFSFPAVTKGYSYTVSVYDYDGGVETFLGDGTSESGATVVPVAAGDTSVDVGAIHAGVGQSRIRGSVVDAEGDGAQYAEIAVWQLQDDDTWEQVRYRYLDDNGDYSFRLPWGGTYTVQADPYDGAGIFLGGGTDIDAAQTFSPSEAQPVLTLDPITLPQTGGDKIRGQVLDKAGDPVANAAVELYSDYCPDEGGCWFQDDYATTNATGHYVFRNVAPGTPHVVSAQKYSAGFDEVFAGQVSRAQDATVYTVPEEGGVVDVADITLDVSEVTGTVVDDAGDGVAGADVVLWYDYCQPDGCWSDWDFTTTDADGNYTFERVDRDRTFTVSAANEDAGFRRTFLGGTDNAESATTFTQPSVGGTTAVDDVTLTPSGLAGRVLDAAGQPLAKAQVKLWTNYCDGEPGCWYEMDNTRTTAAGRYVFLSVNPGGIYTVSASKPTAGLGTTFAGDVADVDAATPYTVADYAQVVADDVTLSAGMRIVRGSLTTSDDQPFDGTADLTLYRLVESSDPGTTALSYDLEYVDETTSDDGTYGFTDVGPGSYTLLASYFPNDGPGYVRSWRGNARPTGPDSPGVFTVDDSGDTLSGVDLVLQRGTTLSGTVTTPNGTPIEDVWVPVSEWMSYYGYEYPAQFDSAYTDEDGHYSVTVPQNADLFLRGYAYGHQPFALGGEFYPSTRTPENTLHTGLTAATYDFTMAPAPVAVEDPVLSGTPEPGQTLSVTNGTWEIDGQPADGLTFTYQWHHVTGTPTTSTYVVQPGDANHRIYVVVIAHRDGFDDQYAYSNRLKVPAGPPVATNDTLPTLSPSDPAVGEEITATPGTWTLADGAAQDQLTFVYKWFRGTHRIDDASGSTYEVRPGDELRDIFVRVVAKRAGYTNVSADSAPVTVADRPLVDQVTAPALTGLAKVGQTLTLDPGDWDADGEPVTLTYRWASGYQTRNADPGSDGLEYTQVASDKDKYLTAFVTATAPGHRKTVWSSTVGPVVAADVALGNLTVTVRDDDTGDPIAGAGVWGCDTSDWSCFASGVTDSAGKFTVQVRNAANYYLAVDGGDGIHHSAQLYLDTPATGDKSQEVRLTKPTPPPANVSIPTQNGSYDGVPTVYFGDPQRFNVTGCAATANPTYTVTFTDGHEPLTGALEQTGAATGDLITFTALIPAFYPAHGDATISTNVPANCDPGTPPTQIHIYIDPSGIVTDQYGRPIEGATVTLSRSDFIGGPYADVPDGSDVMSPANRSNPDTTDAIGYFQWDVVDGWYKVRATAPGCAPTTTPAMQVPPIQVDLLVKLECTAPAPSSTPTITGTPKVGNTLSTTTTGWPSTSTVTNQWKRDGAPIDGATGATYVLTPADANKAITVTQTADRPDFVQEVGRGGPVDFTAATATSAPTNVSKADAPTDTVKAAITGTGKTGQVLTAVAPTWSIGGVTTSAPQWKRDGAPIAGETGATYTVVAGDVGKAITVTYTGTKDGFLDGTSTSDPKTIAQGDAPTASTAAAITGSGKTGQVLTAVAPTWSLGGVTSSAPQWKRDGAPIAGETGATYTVVAGDVGKAITVSYTGTKPGFADGASTSGPVTIVKGDAPTPTTPAAISGSGKVGQALTATAPAWSPTGVTTSAPQWFRDNVAIAGETGTTYTVLAGDVGKAITAKYTGTKAGFFDGLATSNGITGVTGDAPVVNAAPVAAGSGKVGSALTATAPTWTTSGVTTGGRQWLRDGSPIAGETGATYTVLPGDLGKSIAVRFTGTKAGLADALTSSAGIVAVVGDAATAAAPTLHGTPKTGQQLTVDAPTWDAAGVTSSYQWLRDGTPIAGATTAAYTLVAGDVGHLISARVTGARTGYADGTTTSAAVTGALGDAASATTAPAVTGTAGLGKTLTTTDGAWPAGVALTRQWLRDGTAIAGATGSSYVVTLADVGHALSVLVTATQAGYSDGSSTSNVVTVSKVASTTVGKLSAAKAKAGKSVVYTVTVKATGVSGPTGKVSVYDGKKLVKTLTLAAGAKGVVKLTLKKLKKGTHKLSAKYLGSTIVLASVSKVSTLKVK